MCVKKHRGQIIAHTFLNFIKGSLWVQDLQVLCTKQYAMSQKQTNKLQAIEPLITLFYLPKWMSLHRHH